jgi:transcriptional antiterminator RfaH
MSAALRWYVVQTQPHAEAKAAAHLERQDFQTYLPRYLRRRRHARRIDTIAAPLFPGYLFVAVDVARQRWRCIRSTIGVRRLVCNGDEPTPMPDTVVEELRARENGGLIDLPIRPPCALGGKVRVLDGVFASCMGLFEGMSDSERVAVLLDLLGRKVRILLRRDAVAAA